MADRCMGCHQNVGTEVRTRTGLHGRLAGGASGPTCRGCHSDHRGPAGALTDVGNDFPHELTGYSLQGHRASAAGAKVGCRGCHPKALAVFDRTTCSACHAGLNGKFMREHDATFGRDCLTCHGGTDRFGAHFDHSTLSFQLVGKHAQVACVKCHANAGSLVALRKTPKDCYSCHAKDDPHKASFGRDCGACHTPATWQNAKFDHSVFPLDHGSRERKATCTTCHPRDPGSYTCYGCHAHTPANIIGNHEGKTLAELSDCIKCHPGGRKGGD